MQELTNRVVFVMMHSRTRACDHPFGSGIPTLKRKHSEQVVRFANMMLDCLMRMPSFAARKGSKKSFPERRSLSAAFSAFAGAAAFVKIPRRVHDCFTTTFTKIDGKKILVVSSRVQYSPHQRVELVTRAPDRDKVITMFSHGHGIVYNGQLAMIRSLFSAVKTRLDRKRKRPAPGSPPDVLFNDTRKHRSQMAAFMSGLMVQVNPGYEVGAFDVPNTSSEDLTMVLGTELIDKEFLMPFSQLLGIYSASSWQREGVSVAQISDSAIVYPHYSVFLPTRTDYVQALLEAEIPSGLDVCFEVGIGCGVLSALLLNHGKVKRVVASDSNPRAINSAFETFSRLHLLESVELQHTDGFPKTNKEADLIICNPPWLPGKARTVMEESIYDYEHRMLKSFLQSAKRHLNEKGRVCLIMSNIAELLHLREPGFVSNLLEENGFEVEFQNSVESDEKRRNRRRKKKGLSVFKRSQPAVVDLESMKKKHADDAVMVSEPTVLKKLREKEIISVYILRPKN